MLCILREEVFLQYLSHRRHALVLWFAMHYAGVLCTTRREVFLQYHSHRHPLGNRPAFNFLQLVPSRLSAERGSTIFRKIMPAVGGHSDTMPSELTAQRGRGEMAGRRRAG